MKKRIFTLMMAFLAIAGNAVWGQENINITGIETQLPTPSQGTGWKLTHEDIGTAGNKLVISQSGKYVITDAADAAADNSNIQIIVNGNLEDVEITVKNVKTNAQLNNNLDGAETDDKYSNRCAFEINSGTTVTLNWEGTNKFWSSPERAGINVKPGATLILNDEDNSGTLEAGSLCNGGQAHTYGAGIGGDQVEPNFGTIIIENGQINARCESKGNSYSKFDALAAGIGGGYSDAETSTEGTIIIKGGTIEAASWSVDNGKDYESDKTGNQYSYGAGIGGGYKGTCTNIAILGGSVIANSNGAEDIGVGKDYAGSNGIEKGIIIGQWAEDTTAPSVKTINNGNATINDVNIVKGEEGLLKGNVTMPAETQMYTTQTVASTNPDEKFYSYRLNLSESSIADSEDGDHQSTYYEATKNIGNYYLGAKRPFDLPKLSCDKNHIFMGWIKPGETDATFVALNNGKCSMVTPETDATKMDESLMYSPVWVDNDKNILVVSGTNWDEKDTPEISVVPNNALDKLAFSFKNVISDEELKGITFKDNKLSGTPTLQDGDTYFSKDVKATVKWNTGNITSEQEITLHIAIVNEVLINSVLINDDNNPHIYNGQHHNGYTPNDDDHSLVVKMKKTSDGTVLNPEDENLTDGVGYRIYSFTVTNGNESNNQKASDADEEPLPIINAGTYSNITIQALNATFGEEFDGLIKDNSLYTLGNNAKIIVNQRPMDISISFNKQSIEEDEELTWDDVTVTPQALKGNSNSGIVAKDAEDFKKAVTGKITYTLNEEGTIATVKIYDVAVADQGEFLVSNYDLTINGDSYTEGMEVDLDDPEIPVASSSTGGNFNDKRYQLFLANKDYLKTDEKTVEYYEKLGLELFSRHNKKYTEAGHSFTVWYEKDGVANAGDYRLFWSKSGERGDYQEVKFDEVSGYYQIRNVQSDVYVKIYDAAGFPVANEAITAQDFRAYAQPNKIIVITPEPTDVQIISMAGAVVAADKVTGQREFANLAEGVYIVRMGETIVKLQVRN